MKGNDRIDNVIDVHDVTYRYICESSSLEIRNLLRLKLT